MVKKARKTAAKVEPAPPKTPEVSMAEVEAICHLIDHCKRQGIRVFEGPGGLRFSFDREKPPAARSILPVEIGDQFIP